MDLKELTIEELKEKQTFYSHAGGAYGIAAMNRVTEELNRRALEV